MNSLWLAILAGLAGMFGWGLADFFAKKTIDKVGDMATLTWAHVYGVLILFSFVLGRTLANGSLTGLPEGIKEVGLLAFFGALQAAVYFYVYRAFGKGQLALLNPVFSSYSGIVVLISVFIFGEIVGSATLAVLALIFLGIMLINLDKESLAVRRFKFLRIPGMKDILTAVSLASIWTILWGRFVAGKDWLVYAAIMYLFMSITILLISLVKRVNLKILEKKIWKYFLLIGFAEVIAYVGVSLGYSLTTHLSIVAVLSAAFSVPTVVLAHIFLKERVTKLQIMGTSLVIIGVVLVSLV